MSLVHVEATRGSVALTISAVAGTRACAVLDRLAEPHNGTKTISVFPEPWVDNRRHGLVTLVKGIDVKIPLTLVRVNRSEDAEGVLMVDAMGVDVTLFSMPYRVDEGRGLCLMSIGAHVVDGQIDKIARNVLAILAACTSFAKDAQGRMYFDPHLKLS